MVIKILWYVGLFINLFTQLSQAKYYLPAKYPPSPSDVALYQASNTIREFLEENINC